MNKSHPGYAKLLFDVSLMTQEEQRYILEAEQALKLAGVVFDVNEGRGMRTWELDWSLTGANTVIREYCCSYMECSVSLVSPLLWAVYENPRSKKVLYFPYCSEEHRALGAVGEAKALGWRVIACF